MKIKTRSFIGVGLFSFIVIIVSVFVINNNALFSQAVKIRDLPSAPTPSLLDYLPEANASGTPTTYKVTPNALFALRSISCTPPLLCDGSTSMSLGANRTLSVYGPNIHTVNVSCVGVSATDTAAINAAVTQIQAFLGGGVLHLSGQCVIANSIVNNPNSSTTLPLIIEGDGRNSTTLNFTSCTTDCIYLGAQGGIGSGRNDGSGIRDLRINPPAGANAMHLANLQGPEIHNVYVQGGSSALIVEESRFGTFENMYLAQYTQDAVKIIGENFASNWYRNIDMVTTVGVNGVNYTKTGTVDAGGAQFYNVGVNGTLTGSGFLFSSVSTIHPMWIFCNQCVADGNFAMDGFRFVGTRHVYLTSPFGANQYPSANAAAITFDGVTESTITGGSFYGSTGASGEDLNLKNTVSRVSIVGTRFAGPTLAVRVDSTTHDVDMRPSYYASSTFCNDLTKLVPSGSLRYSSPPILLTGNTATTMLGIINSAGTSAQYLGVDSSGNLNRYANNGATLLETLTQAGKVGIGTPSPTSLLTVSANAASLPSPVTGTLTQLGNIDGTLTRFAMNGFANSSSLDFYRADTSNASPSALNVSEVIGAISAFGYDGTTYTSGSRASIQMQTGAAWSSGSTPTMLRFNVTPLSSATITEALRIDSALHVTTLGPTPSVSCTGTGTSPAAPTIVGTDNAFKITINTGTGTPGSTGTCTITYANGFITNTPIWACTLISGASNWGNGATIQVTTESLTAPVFTWNNLVGGVATALTTSSNYKFSCVNIGRL